MAPLERITLDRFLLGVNLRLDAELLGQDAGSEIVLDAFRNEAVMSFRRAFYGRQLQKVRYPTTWLDAVKDRFVPQSLRRYVRINYTEIDVKELYPSVVMPDKKPVITITKAPALSAFYEEN